MTSRRSWLLGLALGAALSVGAHDAVASVPRHISYQGLITDNAGKGLNGKHEVHINYYTAGNSTPIFSQDTSVDFTNGIFNMELGGASGSEVPIRIEGSPFA